MRIPAKMWLKLLPSPRSETRPGPKRLAACHQLQIPWKQSILLFKVEIVLTPATSSPQIGAVLHSSGMKAKPVPTEWEGSQGWDKEQISLRLMCCAPKYPGRILPVVCFPTRLPSTSSCHLFDLLFTSCNVYMWECFRINPRPHARQAHVTLN